ncbi:MAG: 23S rRNA (adenine(2503)-C(2))-methyltransferase RlmN [Paludibacter sp.]|jgi:23S rRNA (adenine2503-C2)-methyltransferase|nr:23S rRNA (adenine(2503)-C(2))-methyltransferase RlmN [Paludibacter sp.]
MKKLLIGETLSELQETVLQEAMPAFTAKQISEWLYKKRAADLGEMTNISLKNRLLLAEKFETGRHAPAHESVSADGTKKYLFAVAENRFVESVYIPDGERHTLCVSVQVGCKMNCLFCMTGKMGFAANLSVAEILNQILSVSESEKLTNIVFMGMGEPMDNLPNVLKTIEILTADYGLAWSPHRITVSTIGIVPRMREFLEQTDCHLAVSVHSPFAAERLQLMPVQKAYPLASVLAELRRHDFSHQRRLSFEYIMFADFNDSPRHAEELARLLRGLRCRVNLIRFHAIPNVDLKPSDETRILAFQQTLENKGIITTIRKSRGEDIAAACGMLSSAVA